MCHAILRRWLLAFMAVFLMCGPALGSSTGANANSSDALDRYASRRDHAATIEQALKGRIAELERRANDLAVRIASLQQQLSTLLRDLQGADDTIKRLQVDIDANRSFVNDSQRRVDKLDTERRQVEQQLEEQKANAWRCYIPFVAIYCLAEKLPERRKTLDEQLRTIGDHLKTARRQGDDSRARLGALEAERRAADNRRAQKQGEVGNAEQQLVALHAALANSRSTYHRHREALESFARELRQIEELPITERQGAIERRLTRLNLQLAKEMVLACRLITTDSPSLPAALRQACALA